MLNEVVGIVTDEEKNEIRKLYERKLALNELFLTLASSSIPEKERNDLYNKVVDDLGKTKLAFEKWWADKSKTYNWKHVTNGQWNINFETNEIFLII